MPGLARWTTQRHLLILLVLLLFWNLYLFPMRTRALRALSNQQNPTVDTWFCYTPTAFYSLAGALGESGRRLYALSEVSLDLIYPILYSSFLGGLLLLWMPNAFPRTAALHKLSVLPGIALFFDYLENATVVILLLNYPRRLTSLAWAASVFTSVKIVLLLVCLLLVLISGLLTWRAGLRKG